MAPPLGRAWPRSTPLRDDRFEIFAGRHERAVAGDIEAIDQTIEVDLERLASLRVERRERLENRTVILAENLDPVLGRLVAEHERPALRRDRGLRTEQGFQMALAAPQRRRLHARCGWHVFADGLEQ